MRKTDSSNIFQCPRNSDEEKRQVGEPKSNSYGVLVGKALKKEAAVKIWA
jgi:hypothetical protein